MEVYRDEGDLEKAVVGGIVTSGRAVFFTATMMSAGVVFWYFSHYGSRRRWAFCWLSS